MACCHQASFTYRHCPSVSEILGNPEEHGWISLLWILWVSMDCFHSFSHILQGCFTGTAEKFQDFGMTSQEPTPYLQNILRWRVCKTNKGLSTCVGLSRSPPLLRVPPFWYDGFLACDLLMWPHWWHRSSSRTKSGCACPGALRSSHPDPGHNELLHNKEILAIGNLWTRGCKSYMISFF